MSRPSLQRLEKMRIEVARLRELLAGLERERASAPRLGWLALLALPAGYVWGPLFALYVLLSAGVILGTALYIIGVRRNEYSYELRHLQSQLSEHDVSAPPGAVEERSAHVSRDPAP